MNSIAQTPVVAQMSKSPYDVDALPTSQVTCLTRAHASFHFRRHESRGKMTTSRLQSPKYVKGVFCRNGDISRFTTARSTHPDSDSQRSQD